MLRTMTAKYGPFSLPYFQVTAALASVIIIIMHSLIPSIQVEDGLY